MKKNVSKDWLTINRICKEIKWLSYDPDYKDIDLKSALKILEQLKEKLGQQLNESR